MFSLKQQVKRLYRPMTPFQLYMQTSRPFSLISQSFDYA